MNSVAEEFKGNFERFKNQSAHRIRCLLDIDGGLSFKVVSDKELSTSFIIMTKDKLTIC